MSNYRFDGLSWRRLDFLLPQPEAGGDEAYQ